MKKRYAIGIDAGLTTGVCVYDRTTRKIAALFSSSFWEAYGLILRDYTPEDTLIVVENPRKNFVYNRNSRQKTEVLTKIAFNAGENNREATLLIEGFGKAGFEVRTQTPEGEKWNAAYFQTITRCDLRTNAHERDAARLVFGL
ncbi:MAG: hypothetical protein JSS81_07280 [Acidobacteria bacterium]|nr:hypothetical protein [Acidobacteriota bacterium]